MPDREKVIAKLEKEVKKTYSIKTTIYNNGKKVNENITEHREPVIKIPMEMADEILALLKEQDCAKDTKDVVNEVIEKLCNPSDDDPGVCRCAMKCPEHTNKNDLT